MFEKDTDLLVLFQGSHFSGLTKFHDISMILIHFQVFFSLFLKCDFLVVFNINLQIYQVSFEPKITHFLLKNNLKLYTRASKSGSQG